MNHSNHPFHLVTNSPWPLIASFMIMNLMINFCQLLYYNSWKIFLFSIMSMILISLQWWRDIIRESTYQGFHSNYVYLSMRLGMIMFIISELMFFLAFFWSFFHSSLAPEIEIGEMWPPKMINFFNPYDIPLLNSIILISSGISITWTHNSILINNKMESMYSLMITILLGIYFSFIQLLEYNEAPFTINDNIYGSTFFMMTGFHGIHVIIGTTFLMICFIRLINNHFSKIHHFGFEAASWYWHFVDIIWLFLYISIYWWNY